MPARDGSSRGGARPGAGHPRTPLAEKIEKGNPGGRPLMVLKQPEPIQMDGVEMPKPSDYLTANQNNGIPLHAAEIYERTWLWLRERNCEKLVARNLLEAYSQNFARYIQCEDAISEYGMLGTHPTSGAAIASPYVKMSQDYQKIANMLWYEIYAIVEQQCTEPLDGNPKDTMEELLKKRKG